MENKEVTEFIQKQFDAIKNNEYFPRTFTASEFLPFIKAIFPIFSFLPSYGGYVVVLTSKGYMRLTVLGLTITLIPTSNEKKKEIHHLTDFEKLPLTFSLTKKFFLDLKTAIRRKNIKKGSKQKEIEKLENRKEYYQREIGKSEKKIIELKNYIIRCEEDIKDYQEKIDEKKKELSEKSAT
jgi:hypothetical protein